jgi:hypothetical protein
VAEIGDWFVSLKSYALFAFKRSDTCLESDILLWNLKYTATTLDAFKKSTFNINNPTFKCWKLLLFYVKLTFVQNLSDFRFSEALVECHFEQATLEQMPQAQMS